MWSNMSSSVFKFIIFILCIKFYTIRIQADEGMWLIQLVSQHTEEMNKLGFELPADVVYNENKSSIKDAIVSFGGFCSGSVISEHGLLLTNHHCGISALAQLSSSNNDYLKHGFIAKNKQEELHVSGLFVRFLIKVEDVTNFILRDVTPEMTEKERHSKIEENKKKLITSLSEGTHYQVDIVSMFYGNEFYAYTYETFNDIRLVAAPPSSIGNFGGETDNWKWPRHTGDFAIFRIYASKENKPADFSKENVPYKPKKWLPISLKGYKENDFAMCIGFPGRTNRYMSSYGVEDLYNNTNPTAIKILQEIILILNEQISTSPLARLRYVDAFSSSANIYKYLKGQNASIQYLNLINRKKLIEDDFVNWASNTSILKTDSYDIALSIIKSSYQKLPELTYIHNYFRFGINRHLRSMQFALKFQNLYTELTKPKIDQKAIQNITQELIAQAQIFYKKFLKTTEQKIFKQLIQLYYNDVPSSYHPQFFLEIEKKYKKNFIIYSDMVYTTSIFADSSKCFNFLKKPTAKILQNDPIFQIALQFNDIFKELQNEISTLRLQLEKGMRLYVKGLREMYPQRKFYPEANSTMRITYGKISGYKSRDAVYYNYVTYLNGVLEKEDSENEEFYVPQKLKELYYNKDFGIYADNNNLMPTCFIADLDITGGSSGSPVLNKSGEIIGVAFDGNWESMSCDLMFVTNFQRVITLDIRYLLFILDKFSGASHLIDEMTLIH